jgi:chromosome partitioning protein
MGKSIAVSNMKGGVGKTMTAASLSAGLARQGKSVLCLDADAQHSLTISFGVSEPEKLTVTLTTMMTGIIEETDFNPAAGIVHHSDGVDLLPSNNTLVGLEIALAGLIGRETILRQYIEKVKPLYDYIVVDCAPSLDLLTINALAAADSVIIPVVPRYLDAKGLELLLKSIAQIRRQINPALSISGILLTMVDRRANFTREIITLVENAYGSKIRIFGEHIPRSVRAAESTAQGVSIFAHDPNGKVAAAYAALTREVLTRVIKQQTTSPLRDMTTYLVQEKCATGRASLKSPSRNYSRPTSIRFKSTTILAWRV